MQAWTSRVFPFLCVSLGIPPPFCPPPSPHCCCRGLENEQTAGNCCVIGNRRGKASSPAARMSVGSTQEDLFPESCRAEHAWAAASLSTAALLTCAGSGCHGPPSALGFSTGMLTSCQSRRSELYLCRLVISSYLFILWPCKKKKQNKNIQGSLKPFHGNNSGLLQTGFSLFPGFLIVVL